MTLHKLCSDCPFAALCMITTPPQHSFDIDMLMRYSAVRDPTLDNADKQLRYVASKARCVQRLKQIGEARYANVVTSTVPHVQVLCTVRTPGNDSISYTASNNFDNPLPGDADSPEGPGAL
jgi:hypothetical protein